MIIETLLLHAADLDALRTFYGKHLGLPVAGDRQGGQLIVTVGASRLVFQHEQDFAGRYHFAFNIPENRLSVAKIYLEARGLSLIADAQGNTLFDFDSWNAHALYFYDAAGNIAELIARHELRNGLSDADHKPFSSAELLCISEIGIPADDVPTLAAMLSESLGMGPYREASPAFTPLGDANGLLILAPEGRSWFPDTQIVAQALPVQAVIKSGTGARFMLVGVPYNITAF